MTVLEVIQKSAEFLEKKGVESPRLQVELLLGHVLSLPRMKLYLAFDRVLQEAEVQKLREAIKRRGNREPLQHIIGSTSFCGLEITVNRNVLIPRPETEILAERAWTFLKKSPAPAPTALDFATGSGCIAISLAHHCPTAKITALDLSPEALKTAQTNAENLKVSDRIRFLESDAFAALSGEKFDLIVSNPPYISPAEIATLDPEVRDFDPRMALDGGADGLEFYRLLAKQSAQFLQPGGKLMMEFGDGQGLLLRDIFEAEQWLVEAIEKDYSGRERFLNVSLR